MESFYLNRINDFFSNFANYTLSWNEENSSNTTVAFFATAGGLIIGFGALILKRKFESKPLKAPKPQKGEKFQVVEMGKTVKVARTTTKADKVVEDFNVDRTTKVIEPVEGTKTIKATEAIELAEPKTIKAIEVVSEIETMLFTLGCGPNQSKVTKIIKDYGKGKATTSQLHRVLDDCKIDSKPNLVKYLDYLKTFLKQVIHNHIPNSAALKEIERMLFILGCGCDQSKITNIIKDYEKGKATKTELNQVLDDCKSFVSNQKLEKYLNELKTFAKQIRHNYLLNKAPLSIKNMKVWENVKDYSILKEQLSRALISHDESDSLSNYKGKKMQPITKTELMLLCDELMGEVEIIGQVLREQAKGLNSELLGDNQDSKWFVRQIFDLKETFLKIYRLADWQDHFFQPASQQNKWLCISQKICNEIIPLFSESEALGNLEELKMFVEVKTKEDMQKLK